MIKLKLTKNIRYLLLSTKIQIKKFHPEYLKIYEIWESYIESKAKLIKNKIIKDFNIQKTKNTLMMRKIKLNDENILMNKTKGKVMISEYMKSNQDCRIKILEIENEVKNKLTAFYINTVWSGIFQDETIGEVYVETMNMIKRIIKEEKIGKYKIFLYNGLEYKTNGYISCDCIEDSNEINKNWQNTAKSIITHSTNWFWVWNNLIELKDESAINRIKDIKDIKNNMGVNVGEQINTEKIFEQNILWSKSEKINAYVIEIHEKKIYKNNKQITWKI